MISGISFFFEAESQWKAKFTYKLSRPPLEETFLIKEANPFALWQHVQVFGSEPLGNNLF